MQVVIFSKRLVNTGLIGSKIIFIAHDAAQGSKNQGNRGEREKEQKKEKLAPNLKLVCPRGVFCNDYGLIRSIFQL